MDLSAISNQNLHHAYFIEGDHELLIPNLLSHLENEQIIERDKVIINIFPVFYIEHSRNLKDMQEMVSDTKRIIIIAFDRMIEAAEQALLKTLEEPTANTHFFFLSRNSKALLPTVRSRMFIISSRERKDTFLDDSKAKDYLSSDYFGRNELVKDLIDDARGDEDEDKALAKRELMKFLDSIERVLADSLYRNDITIADSLSHILLAKKNLDDPSPSVKMIFEHLAIRLQKIK